MRPSSARPSVDEVRYVCKGLMATMVATGAHERSLLQTKWDMCVQASCDLDCLTSHLQKRRRVQHDRRSILVSTTTSCTSCKSADQTLAHTFCAAPWSSRIFTLLWLVIFFSCSLSFCRTLALTSCSWYARSVRALDAQVMIVSVSSNPRRRASASKLSLEARGWKALVSAGDPQAAHWPTAAPDVAQDSCTKAMQGISMQSAIICVTQHDSEQGIPRTLRDVCT